jgi:hypothetical protein
MSYKELYKLAWENHHWTVYKCDKVDYEPTGSYAVSDIGGRLECSCFANNKSTCRHREMVRRYKVDPAFREKMDTGWMWNHDREVFLPPLQQLEN